MPSHHLDRSSPSSRARLLRAAKRLFAAQGYEQTATSAIAREAGTSESQLMRYFGGKAGVLEALFEEAWSGLNQRVSRVTADTPPRQGLIDTAQTLVTALARDRELATLMLFEGRRLRGDGPRVKLSRGFTAFIESIRQLIRAAQAEGSVHPAHDVNAVTSAVLGATEGMVRDRLLTRGRTGRGFAEREIARTLEALISGLAARPARGAARGAKAARRP